MPVYEASLYGGQNLTRWIDAPNIEVAKRACVAKRWGFREVRLARPLSLVLGLAPDLTVDEWDDVRNFCTLVRWSCQRITCGDGVDLYRLINSSGRVVGSYTYPASIRTLFDEYEAQQEDKILDT